jgi:hypothetical protein
LLDAIQNDVLSLSSLHTILSDEGLMLDACFLFD